MQITYRHKRKQRGSLYQRPTSPNWYCKYRTRDGKLVRRSLKTTHRDEARRKLDTLVAAESAPEPAAPQRRTPFGSFDSIATEWLEIYQSRAISASRKRIANTLIRGRFTDAFGGQPIAAITEVEVNRFLNGRLEEAAYATVAEERMYLSAIFKVAIRKGLVNYNPVDDYRFPRGANRKSDKRRHLTLDQFEHVMSFVNDPIDNAGLKLFFATGARKGELQGAKFSDVIVNGDGIVKLRIRGENSKTRKDRLIPLSESTSELIELLRSESGGDYILPRGRVQSEYWRKALKAAQRKAGIDDPISLHGLRHSFCSYWANRSDVSWVTIQKWAGHETINGTEIYIHLDKNTRERAYQAMRDFTF